MMHVTITVNNSEHVLGDPRVTHCQVLAIASPMLNAPGTVPFDIDFHLPFVILFYTIVMRNCVIITPENLRHQRSVS